MRLATPDQRVSGGAWMVRCPCCGLSSKPAFPSLHKTLGPHPLIYAHTRNITDGHAFLPTQVTTYAGGITAALGPNVFTDIAFESSVGVYAPETRHVFVSSASGAVFEIDYAR